MLQEPCYQGNQWQTLQSFSEGLNLSLLSVLTFSLLNLTKYYLMKPNIKWIVLDKLEYEILNTLNKYITYPQLEFFDV